MQDHLASPHARRFSAGEDEIDRLLEIAFCQTIRIRRVPVVELSRTARKRFEFRHLLRSRRLKRVRQSLQVMLKDSIDHMYMVEDAEHDAVAGIAFAAVQPPGVAQYQALAALQPLGVIGRDPQANLHASR